MVTFNFEKSEEIDDILPLFDTTTLKTSLFSVKSMRSLFDNGNSISTSSSNMLNVDKMGNFIEEIGIQMTNEQAYALYRYLKTLSYQTFRRGGEVGQDSVPFAFKSVRALNQTLTNFTSEFGSRIIGAVALKYLKSEDCKVSVERVLGAPGQGQSAAICNDPRTDMTELKGVTFWFRLYIGRLASDISTLNDVTGLSLTDLDTEFESSTSNFRKFLGAILGGLQVNSNFGSFCKTSYSSICSLTQISQL